MARFVSLPEAKTKLSAPVDRAVAGEEIIIARYGTPDARLVPIASRGHARTPAGAMKVGWIALDFDALHPAIEQLFAGHDE